MELIILIILSVIQIIVLICFFFCVCMYLRSKKLLWQLILGRLHLIFIIQLDKLIRQSNF